MELASPDQSGDCALCEAVFVLRAQQAASESPASEEETSETAPSEGDNGETAPSDEDPSETAAPEGDNNETVPSEGDASETAPFTGDIIETAPSQEDYLTAQKSAMWPQHRNEITVCFVEDDDLKGESEDTGEILFPDAPDALRRIGRSAFGPQFKKTQDAIMKYASEWTKPDVASRLQFKWLPKFDQSANIRIRLIPRCKRNGDPNIN